MVTRRKAVYFLLVVVVVAAAVCWYLMPVRLVEGETWDVYRIQGVPAGYGRTSIHYDTEDGRKVIKVAGRIHLTTLRFGQPAVIELDFVCTETPAGALLGYEGTFGGMKTVGRVRSERLELETTSRGQVTKDSQPWPADGGGPMAAEESLLRQPMRPGQRRTVSFLSPGDNSVIRMEMTARQEEDANLLAGTSRLLKIETVEQMKDGPRMTGTIWADATGHILKQQTNDAMNMERFRVSKETALAPIPLSLDLGLKDVLVRLARPLPQGDDCPQARYGVRLERGDPAAAFASGPAQRVKRTADQTAEVTVYAVRPGHEGNPDAKDDPPTDADLKSNNFIQSDDPRIVADARKAAGDESDRWRVAVALERYAHDAIAGNDFTQALQTAAAVAQSRRGDCKAHALYLAALARARGIPARVATGLLYLPPSQGFAYHMWTEIYVGKRWIGLDAVLGKGGIGAGHLQLSHGNMAGSAAYVSLLALVEVIGQLHVELLDPQ